MSPTTQDAPAPRHATTSQAGLPEPLFPEDEGTLPAEVRATLVRVLSSRFVDGVRNPGLWTRTLRHENVLRSRLHDLYLDLVIDRRRQIAFTQQLELDDDVPVLLRKDRPLTLAATVLLLHLRQEYDRGAVEGRDVVVEHHELLEYLESWKDVDDQNPATFRKRCESAIESTKEKGILAPVSEGRYRISGVIHSLLTAEKVDAMTDAFTALAHGPAAPDEAAPVAEEEHENDVHGDEEHEDESAETEQDAS